MASSPELPEPAEESDPESLRAMFHFLIKAAQAQGDEQAVQMYVQAAQQKGVHLKL